MENRLTGKFKDSIYMLNMLIFIFLHKNKILLMQLNNADTLNGMPCKMSSPIHSSYMS